MLFAHLKRIVKLDRLLIREHNPRILLKKLASVFL